MDFEGFNLIGRNTFTHEGDVFEFLQKLKDESVDICFTDPPYPLGRIDLSKWTDTVKYKSGIHYKQLKKSDLDEFMKIMFKKMKPNSTLFLMTNRDNREFFSKSIENAGFKLKNELTWVKITHFKEGMAMGQHYLNGTETILYAQKGEFRRVNTHFNVFVKNSPNRGRNSKPEELYAYFIEPHLQKNEVQVIVDPFAGSDPLSRANLRGFLGKKTITITNYLATGDNTDPAHFAKLIANQSLRKWLEPDPRP